MRNVLVLWLVVLLGTQGALGQATSRGAKVRSKELEGICGAIDDWKKAIETEDSGAFREACIVSDQVREVKLFELARAAMFDTHHLREVITKRFGPDSRSLDRLLFMLPVEEQLGIVSEHADEFELLIADQNATLYPTRPVEKLVLRDKLYFKKSGLIWKVDVMRMLRADTMTARDMERQCIHFQEVSKLFKKTTEEVNRGMFGRVDDIKSHLRVEYMRILDGDAANIRKGTTQPAATMPSISSDNARGTGR